MFAEVSLKKLDEKMELLRNLLQLPIPRLSRDYGELIDDLMLKDMFSRFLYFLFLPILPSTAAEARHISVPRNMRTGVMQLFFYQKER